MAAYLDDVEEFNERRKERRWNIPVPVRVKGTLADGTAFEEDATTADVGPAGMCVLISRAVRAKDRLEVAAPEEHFEAAATVVSVSPLGANLHRVRMAFNPPAEFDRKAAAKKYIYDYESNNWIGYLVDGKYFNSKHEEFGRVDGRTIIRQGTDQLLFQFKLDRVYDTRGNCIGHII